MNRGRGSGKPAVRRDAGTDLPGAVVARDSCGPRSATVLVRTLAEEHFGGHAVHGFATLISLAVSEEDFCGHAVHGFATVLANAVHCRSLVTSLSK